MKNYFFSQNMRSYDREFDILTVFVFQNIFIERNFFYVFFHEGFSHIING